MKNDEKPIDSSSSLISSHTTTLSTEHANPYLDLILKEIVYIIKRNKELKYDDYRLLMKMFNSVLYETYDKKRTKKELHRTWLFTRCLIDLIANKPEIISYMISEICKIKIMENRKFFNVWEYILYDLAWSTRPCVRLFDPQSTQITFITESCYELSKKSIYDLENVITKFILNDDKEKGKEYTLNDLHPIYIDGIAKFLEVYTHPLMHVLTGIVKNYWVYKLLKLMNKETKTLKVTPEIWQFTQEVFQFHKNFYMKINKEFEDFDCKNTNEKNNIIPFIYYILSMMIIKLLIYTIRDIYDKLFKFDEFTNWDEFAKLFIPPLYEIYDNFCEKLIIGNNRYGNKFKLYKYFSSCNNKELGQIIWSCGKSVYHSIDYIFTRMYLPILEKYEDEEWINIKNNFPVSRYISEKWIDYFKKSQ